MGEKRGWGLLSGLALVNLALFAAYSGVLSVLLPQQVATIAPNSKVESLALVTSVSFAVTAIAQPLIGALSDRTVSRWGRRVPWMIAGAIAGGVALGAMGGATSVALLAVLWAAAQFALNGTDIASSVYLVDAFPAGRRGRVAGVLGLSAVVGGAAGSVVAGIFTSPGEGYLLLAVAVLLAVAIFVVVFRERQTLDDAPRERIDWRAFLAGFWLDPRRHPDFAWVLAWRLVFAVAYGSVHGYLFYILTDYVGVGESEAPGLVGQVTVVGGAGVLIAVVFGGWLSDRLGRRKPFLVAACLLVAIANIVPLIAPSLPGIIALAGALGFALGLAIACGTALASEVLPDPAGAAGRGLGIFNLGSNVGQAAAPLVAAVIISSQGGYPALFIAGAILMLVAGSVVFAIRGAR